MNAFLNFFQLIILSYELNGSLLRVMKLLENLGMLVSQDSHISLRSHILCSQPINHHLHCLHLLLLLFLRSYQHIHLIFHSIEVTHEFGQNSVLQAFIVLIWVGLWDIICSNLPLLELATAWAFRNAIQQFLT